MNNYTIIMLWALKQPEFSRQMIRSFPSIKKQKKTTLLHINAIMKRFFYFYAIIQFVSIP